ncbi:MAG: flavodoxin [Patescibacteria group bacterium]|jgi:flavodoxin
MTSENNLDISNGVKILVAYYSRTGITKKLAEFLAEKLGAQTEEIKDTVNRAGAVGYMLAGRDAMQRKLTKLEPLKLNPADFDLVIIGTPVWAWNMSAPIRTYLTEHKDKFKQVAFFCTMGSDGDIKTFKEMGEIINKKPVAVLALKTKEVVDNSLEKAEKFLGEIKGL